MYRWYQGSMINATMWKWLSMHSFGRLLHSSRNFLTHSVSHTPNPNKLKYWREPCVGVSLWSVGVISFNRRDVTLNESGTVYGCSPYLVKAQKKKFATKSKHLSLCHHHLAWSFCCSIKIRIEASRDVIGKVPRTFLQDPPVKWVPPKTPYFT